LILLRKIAYEIYNAIFNGYHIIDFIVLTCA